MTDIKQRYYGLMEQLTKQRVADEVGSDSSSERRFSDISEYDADNHAEQQPETEKAADFGEAVSIGETASNDGDLLGIQEDEEDTPKPDAYEEQLAAEDELGICEGSTMNIAAVVAASQVDPEKCDSDKESSKSSSSSSSDSSSVNSKTFEVLLREPVEDASSGARDMPVMENLFKVRGGKYHLCSANSESHFICGAKITPRASRQVTSPAFFSPKCPKCFKA